jgi:hypothetical protein
MDSGANSGVIKELNAILVRKALKTARRATRQQLAEATGLSSMTVGTVLCALARNGEALEAELLSSQGGRPARQYRFNENHAQALILFPHEEAGRDILHLRVANLFGECLHAEDKEIGDVSIGSFEPLIDRALSEYPAIGAIGIGLPGVETEGKVVCNDYPALVGASLSGRYRDRYGLPIVVENDVNAAALGYCRRGKISGKAAMVYLYFPTKHPPGAGICVGGELYRGKSGYAGEVGSIPLGIDWGAPRLYASPAARSRAIGRLIAAIAAFLNPGSAILHGEFLGEADIGAIEAECAHWVPHNALPSIGLSRDFSLDYQNGLFEETLALMEPRSPSPTK